MSSNWAEEQCAFVFFGFFSFFSFFLLLLWDILLLFLTTQSSRGNVTGNTIMSLLIGAAALLAGVSQGSLALSPRWRKISPLGQFWRKKKSFLGNEMSPGYRAINISYSQLLLYQERPRNMQSLKKNKTLE